MLTVGSVCGIASQLPGGAIVDGVRSKRAVVAVALVMVAGGALLFYFSATFWFVLLAQLMHGLTAGLITPAKAAIGLGLVGHRGLSRRLGRNHRYDSFGNAGTAGAMGVLGHFVAKSASFLFAAFLCLPALWALFRIRGGEIDYARARNAKPGETDKHPARYRDLLKNQQLLIFAGALVLFQIANASAIPLVTERLGQNDGGQSDLIVAGLVIVPQVITALIAPWMARRADAWGRKPLLLVAFAALVARVLLFTIAPGPLWLLPMQALSGIDAAVLGILSPVDYRRRDGRKRPLQPGPGRRGDDHGHRRRAQHDGDRLHRAVVWLHPRTTRARGRRGGRLRVHRRASAREPAGGGRVSL